MNTPIAQNKTIHLHVDEDPFARVRKQMLNDTSLSWKAKGILAYLLGKPHGWKVQTTDLMNRSNDGDFSVKSGLMELRKAGYVKLEKHREAGKIVGVTYHVADKPIFLNNSPEVENPLLVKPDGGNRPLSKNDYSKNDPENDVAEATAVKQPGLSLPIPEPTQAPQAPPKAQTDQKSKSDHRLFVEAWETAFVAKHGNAYRFDGGKDARAVKLLLASGDSREDLIALAGRCWERASEYPFGSALTIAGFNSKLNEIRVRIKIAPKVQFRGPVQSARPVGRKPEAREEGRQLDAITKL